MPTDEPPPGIAITGSIDLDVFDAIRLIVPGEPCPYCHGAGQYVVRSGHTDYIRPCPFCRNGLKPHPLTP